MHLLRKELIELKWHPGQQLLEYDGVSCVIEVNSLSCFLHILSPLKTAYVVVFGFYDLCEVNEKEGAPKS